jgi:hypothetical protein
VFVARPQRSPRVRHATYLETEDSSYQVGKEAASWRTNSQLQVQTHSLPQVDDGKCNTTRRFIDDSIERQNSYLARLASE